MTDAINTLCSTITRNYTYTSTPPRSTQMLKQYTRARVNRYETQNASVIEPKQVTVHHKHMTEKHYTRIETIAVKEKKKGKVTAANPRSSWLDVIR